MDVTPESFTKATPSRLSSWKFWVALGILLLIILIGGSYLLFQYKVHKMNQSLELMGFETGPESSSCLNVAMKPINCTIERDEPYITVKGEVTKGVPSTMKGIVKDSSGQKRGVSKMPIMMNIGIDSVYIGKETATDRELDMTGNLEATVMPGINYENGSTQWCEPSVEWIICTKG